MSRSRAPKPTAFDRRTFLQGSARVIALPFLESLLPRRAWAAGSSVTAPVRLVAFYVPCGMLMDQWKPASTGANYALSPTLAPLAALQNNFAVISNTTNYNPNNPSPGAHAIGTAGYATAAPINAGSAPIKAGVSFDQAVAASIGSATRIPSLQLGCYDDPDGDGVYADTYNSCISWASSTSPLKPQFSVATTFKKLFPTGVVQGANASKIAVHGRDAPLSTQKSILDGAVAQAAALQKKLGTQDAAVLDQYLTSLRELEQAIVVPQATEPTGSGGGTGGTTGGSSGTTGGSGTAPSSGGSGGMGAGSSGGGGAGSVPGAECTAPSGATFDAGNQDYVTQAKQLAQLIPLAFQCDQTRVISYMFAAGESYRIYKNLGISAKHHYISHYTAGESGLGYSGNVAALKKIQLYEVQCFAALLSNMKAVQESNGTLLDNSVVLLSSEFGDSQTHAIADMPVLLAGGAGGRFKAQGQHLAMAKGTRYAQVLLTAMRGCGLSTASFGQLGESGTIPGML